MKLRKKKQSHLDNKEKKLELTRQDHDLSNDIKITSQKVN